MYTKHHKRFIVSISVIIVVALLITILYISKTPSNSYSETMSILEHKGTILHHIDDGKDFWGLKISFWDRPFGPKKLRIKNLPENFQVEQLKVNVRYGIADVIGTSDWDVIIDIIDIQKI